MDPQDTTPHATKGFGSREDADATRQSQHSISNDAPTDVNPNATLARVQTASMALIQDAAQSSQSRRTILADHFQALIQATNVKPA